jgi:hypothetical protein
MTQTPLIGEGCTGGDLHAGGVQANYIDLAHAWNVFFKYEKEYRAEAHPKGTTIVFGVV